MEYTVEVRTESETVFTWTGWASTIADALVFAETARQEQVTEEEQV